MSSKNQKGFTLIELMVVVLVISIGIIGVMNLISSIFIYTKLISSKLTAGYLAQEGIEIVRNIRDNNWLEGGVDWDDGLVAGDFEADYSYQALLPDGDNYLKILNGGFYNYSSGDETEFKRKITLTRDNTYEVLVTVIITWDSHEVKVMEKLYDWK